MTEPIMRDKQRAEHVVNSWLDYLGCGASEDFSLPELDELRRVIRASLYHARREERQAIRDYVQATPLPPDAVAAWSDRESLLDWLNAREKADG